MEDQVQKSLERYDVLDRIAVGGMAEVFLAKAYGAHGFEKTLAIKRILPELASDPEFAARFIAEAKVAVKLSHANVVQVFDFGRIGESLFIAMEYVDGLDLAALLRKFKEENRYVPLPAALHIAIEIIRGLDFAHQHNVVHRDVSPSNILISRAGEVKLGDFGIAVAAAPHRSGGPGPRKVMGKWRYMSPEQARGDTLDTRSDLFSAASVMFELFTGAKLFPGEEAEDIIKNIESMAIPRASSIRPGLPSRLDEILAGPLSRKPIDRPARPAIVLRSLIELSYESSIMATALDVAEAVAQVLPAKRISGPGQQLDDVIRKQLGAAHEGSVARRTAVTDGKPSSTATLERGEVSTGLFRKIGGDGISRLEEVDPTDSFHKVVDGHFDSDRRTEVGGPPTGQVPKADVVIEPKSITDSVERSSRRGMLIAALLGVIAAGAFVIWKVTRRPETSVVVASRDAAADVQYGTLEIDPDPEGATGHIADAAGVIADHGRFGPTSHKSPTRLQVEAGKPFRVHLELAGYEPFDKVRIVKPNETVVIAPTLDRARARLRVTTTPPGAQVSLGRNLLGETPLHRDDLEPAASAELSIVKAGFEPVKQTIALVAGNTTEIAQSLKPGQRYGTIRLLFKGQGWADVYLKGARIGRAPSEPLRLPIGRQQLDLVNHGDESKPAIRWSVSCDVAETELKDCHTQLP